MRNQKFTINRGHPREFDHDEHEASLEESQSCGTAITSDTNGRSFQYNIEEDGRGGYYYTTVEDGNLNEIERSGTIKNYNHGFKTDAQESVIDIVAYNHDCDGHQCQHHHQFIDDERNNPHRRFEYEDSISYKSRTSHNYASKHDCDVIEEASGRISDMENESFEKYQLPLYSNKHSIYTDAQKYSSRWSENIQNNHIHWSGCDHEDSERNKEGIQGYYQSNLDSFEKGAIGNNTIQASLDGKYTSHEMQYTSAEDSTAGSRHRNKERNANLLVTSYRSKKKKTRKANFDRLPKHEKQKYIQKNFGSNLQYISSDGKKTIGNSSHMNKKNEIEKGHTYYRSNFPDVVSPMQGRTKAKDMRSLLDSSDNAYIIDNDNFKFNLTSDEQESYISKVSMKKNKTIRRSPNQLNVPQRSEKFYEPCSLTGDATKLTELNTMQEAPERNSSVNLEESGDLDQKYIENYTPTSRAGDVKSATSMYILGLASDNNDSCYLQSNVSHDDCEVSKYPTTITKLENDDTLTHTPSQEEYHMTNHKQKNRVLFFLLMWIAFIILSLILTYFLWYVPNSKSDDNEGIELQGQINSNVNLEADDSLSLLEKQAESEMNDDNFGSINDVLANNNDVDDRINFVFASDDFFDDDFSSPIREHSPSKSPTDTPSFVASIYPSKSTSLPSRLPSRLPSMSPTYAPSQIPTMSTNEPSLSPSGQSSTKPTFSPTLHPTVYPSSLPTSRPTYYPIQSPSHDPSFTPTESPTGVPQWKITAPLLHTKSNLKNNYGYSTSLSSSGNRLAVLHRNGVAIYDFISTASGMQWSKVGDDIPPVWLLFDVGLTWDEVRSNTMLVSSRITLSSDGTEVAWNIALADLGRVAIFTFQNGVWTIRGQVGGYEKTPGGAYYGPSVAYAKSNKSRVLVGGWNGQSARIYENNGSTWTNVGNTIEGFTPSMIQSLLGNTEGSLFGASVAISSDGLIIAVAAPHDGAKERGTVKVYNLNLISQVWEQKGQTLSGTLNSNFGILSMSGYGDRIAVGIPTMDMVQIYEYSNAELDWLLISAKTSDFSSEKFGQMVTFSEDGNSLAVIAPMTGRVCVFKNVSNAWLLESNCLVLGSVENEYLLFSVALSGNGERLVIGHPGIGVMVFTQSPTLN